MDPIEQNNYATPATAQAPAKPHHAMLWILLPLVVVAALLFLLVGSTDKADESMITDDSYIMSDEAIEGAGEDPDATAEESAAIRADLEASDTDGVSEGI